MKHKIGLKLFSNNIEASKVAEEYFSEKHFNYLELMSLPNTYNKTIEYWQRIRAPFIIHAPHASHNFNLSIPDLRERNIEMFSEPQKFADSLNAQIIIVHPGLVGEVAETISQIKGLKDKRIVIENKPFISLLQTRCVGSSPEEIRQILDETGVGFCLDIVHAVKSAFANGKNYIDYIRELVFLGPKIVHLCDCKIDGCFDEHLSFGEGELDLSIVFRLISEFVPAALITLETPEKSYSELTDFKKDRLWIEKYLREGIFEYAKN